MRTLIQYTLFWLAALVVALTLASYDILGYAIIGVFGSFVGYVIGSMDISKSA